MNEKDPKNLTPGQSADMLRYFHNVENSEYRVRGWEDRISLGRSAIHITKVDYSLLPDGKPMLNPKEAGEGLEYIKQNPPIERPPKSDAYEKELDRRVDTRGISYDEARRELDAEGWE